mmetsp:Transcript_23855/g.33130  ORF Transcript_23855/g.33130 Transcript_23855/m.33130 type:complete len:236 (-) Transcript_23855:494-1201(-)
MTLPNLPKSGLRRPRKLLAAGGTEAQVTSILERDTRYKFLKTGQSQFSRFIKALRELLSHYSKTIRTFMKTHEHLREENTNGKSFKQKLTSCKKTYETAIEQLLEKAYHEAKEEAITTRIAAFSSQDGGEASPPRLMTSSRSTRQANSASCSSSVSSSSRNGCEHGKRLNFKREQVYYLSKWFEEHVDDPYPSPNTKFELARQSGLSFKQVSNWFINARSRRLSSQDKKKLRRAY